MADLAPVLILASASPRRAHILTQLGIAFRTHVSQADETLGSGESATAAAVRLAQAKASDVARHEELPVLAADTLVACDERILGKPASADDACRMLRLLAGRTHQVVTGVCLVAAGRSHVAVELTDVRFAPMTEDEIRWYVATEEPMDKAGAYHVDARGGLFVEHVSGSPSNVAGLPIRVVLRLVREAGLAVGLP